MPKRQVTEREFTRESWRSAMRRCREPTYSNYSNYGGRGICFAECWNDLDAFIADLGVRPAGTCLDRIDSNGNYEPGNCRWVSMKQQQRNRRNNKLFEYRGVLRTIPEIAELAGLSRFTVYRRVMVQGLAADNATAPGRVSKKSSTSPPA